MCTPAATAIVMPSDSVRVADEDRPPLARTHALELVVPFAAVRGDDRHLRLRGASPLQLGVAPCDALMCR